MKNNYEKLLMKFLDGELSADEERKALHLIAENEEMRSLLKFDRLLFRELAEEFQPELMNVPDGFADDVMSQIYALEQEQETTSLTVWEKMKEWLGELFEPKQVEFRPAFAYLILAFLVIGYGFYSEMISGSQMNRFTSETQEMRFVSEIEQEERVWIRFVYIDEEADNISVAGDFSEWEPISLDLQIVDGKQVWSGLVPVTRGEHRYMFVRDGVEWLTDPLADVQRDDGFGNKNAVLYL